MNVSEAVASRSSTRSFLEKPVATELLRELLSKASRAPSGGNLQPWRVFVITADTMPEFLAHCEAAGFQKEPEYQIYPAGLQSPYRDSRFKVGEDMYALLGIPREDKAAALASD